MFLELILLRPYLVGWLVLLFTWFRPIASLVRAGKAVFLEFVLAIVLVVHFLSWLNQPYVITRSVPATIPTGLFVVQHRPAARMVNAAESRRDISPREQRSVLDVLHGTEPLNVVFSVHTRRDQAGTTPQ